MIVCVPRTQGGQLRRDLRDLPAQLVPQAVEDQVGEYVELYNTSDRDLAQNVREGSEFEA